MVFLGGGGERRSGGNSPSYRLTNQSIQKKNLTSGGGFKKRKKLSITNLRKKTDKPAIPREKEGPKLGIPSKKGGTERPI